MIRRIAARFASSVALAAALVTMPALAANPQVEFDTTLGKIRIELYPDAAPKTVANFIDYVKAAKKADRDWLFPDVPLVKKKGVDYNAPDVETIMVPSQNAATQWFGRFSDECGVSDSALDFHALRGNFITFGAQLGSSLSLRMEIAGHANGSGVHQTYIYAGSSL